MKKRHTRSSSFSPGRGALEAGTASATASLDVSGIPLAAVGVVPGAPANTVVVVVVVVS